jgi:hypothetical protein
VPVGTSVRLLDKVFAKKPRLHAAHLEAVSSKGKADKQHSCNQEDVIDDIVSTDAVQLLTHFQQYRTAQARLGHKEKPLTLQGIAAMEPVQGREARRGCAGAMYCHFVPAPLLVCTVGRVVFCIALMQTKVLRGSQGLL